MIVGGPDCKLNVEIIGEGDPVTIFAHGITGSTDEVAPVAEHVSGTRVLLDFRGHGSSESPPVEAGYDHPAMRRDLEHVADRFAATRAVAQSMGAGALMNLLADRPDRFERIVIITPASIDGPNEGAAGLFGELADRIERGPVEEVIAWSLEGSQEQLARRPQWRGLIDERVRRMSPVGVPRALRAYIDGRPPVGDASALGNVRAPVLVLANEGDAVHDAAVARRLVSIFPNAELRMWSEPLEMFDDYDVLSKLIAEFLDG